MGEVYKLRDLTLNRIVAGKDRPPRPEAAVAGVPPGSAAMALFSDRRSSASSSSATAIRR
jgi:hypothetical protein